MLIAGGISLFLGLQVYSIHKGTEQGFTHTLIAGGIYDTLHLIVSEVQYIQATGMFDRFDRLPNLRRTLAERIRTYHASHFIGGVQLFTAVESLLVERLRQIEADLGILLDQVEKNFGSRVYLQPGDMVRLRDVLDRGMENSKNLHNFHQAAVLNLSRQGQRLIRLVVWLYMLFVAIGILLVVAASLMLRGKVAMPLGEIAGAALRISEGRLDQRVAIASRDEIGKLSHAFNIMVDRLQERERDLHAAHVRLERKVWELDILHRIGTDLLAFKGVEGPDAILRSVVNHTRQIMNVEAAAICLFIPGREEVEVRSTSGPADAFWVRGGVVGCSAACLENQEHRLTDCPVMRPEYLRSHLPLPLNRGGDSVGVLCVASREERIFSSEEKKLLTSMAAQVAIAVEHGRLEGEVRRLAVLEERGRIARDMHDGLAQLVSLLHLRIRQAQALIPRGESSRLGHALEEMASLSENAYDEVRQSIFGLRTMVSGNRGFVPTLTEFLHEFSVQSDIPVKLEAEGAEAIRLPPAAEVHLARIVQEALTNVRKHAQASLALVRVERLDGWVRVSVEDDGRGFDVARIDAPNGLHFGLQGMRERAEGVGGKLEIVTAPGQGTQVMALLPLEESS